MIFDVASWILFTAGGLVGVIGAIGMHRFNDFFSRQHAAGTTDTLCALLILLGLGLQSGWNLALFKLAMIFMFLFLTSPAASHALANAAILSGLKPKTNDKKSGSKV